MSVRTSTRLAYNFVKPLQMSARKPSLLSSQTRFKNISQLSKSSTALGFDMGHSEGIKTVPLTREKYNTMTPSMQKLTLMDKVVVLAGGARGLGNCMSRACVEAGARAIIIVDTDKEDGELAVTELREAMGSKISVDFFLTDVRNSVAVSEAIQAIVRKHGAPDILINSAGIADSNLPAESYKIHMWRRMIDINLTGSFIVSQAVAKAMIAEQNGGSIILIASMSGGIVNYPQEQSCYNASKAGVIQLGKSLAAEWAKHSIRVNCISPGWYHLGKCKNWANGVVPGYMDTTLNQVPILDAQKKIWKSLTPQNRLGDVGDLNGLAIFLASEASGFMTGSNIVIDGGYTLY
ncbi:MAG: hypothetical protein M1818_002477 [Claussenomyces sp. TS43310]|nr:MAG: hypothetical protein M1818_002477 [Claussenomyces sp. TS43310]